MNVSINIRVVLVMALLLASVSNLALADEFQPITVRIAHLAGDQNENVVYSVRTRIPNDRRILSSPYIVIPERCESESAQQEMTNTRGRISNQAWRCTSSLHGADLRMEFPQRNLAITTIISIDHGNNESVSTVMAAEQPNWTVPAALSSGEVAVQYLALGFKHLITGFDHLLFVLCLLFICFNSIRLLVLTVTSFTLAHSLSLGLTAFGFISLHTTAVEAIIALSIAYLASDIIRNRRESAAGNAPLSHRYPGLVASGFGLLHGLGFANILSEFGLPHNDKLIALLSFNIGIEVGQLAFIACIFVGIWLIKRVVKQRSSTAINENMVSFTTYTVGCIAMFWTVERVLGVF